MPLAPHSAHYLEIGAAHREELLNHVLRALLNLALVENVSERVEHFYASPHAATRTVQTLTALSLRYCPHSFVTFTAISTESLVGCSSSRKIS